MPQPRRSRVKRPDKLRQSRLKRQLKYEKILRRMLLLLVLLLFGGLYVTSHELPVFSPFDHSQPVLSALPEEDFFELFNRPDAAKLADQTLLAPEATISTTDSEVELVFAGDVLLHEPIVNEGLLKGTKPDYSWLFQHIKEINQEADFAFANMEGTLTGEPYCGYPLFRAPREVATNLKEAGFTHITTINNHSMDGGPEGVASTLEALRAAGLSTLGTRLSPEEKSYVILEKAGLKIACTAFSYGSRDSQGLRALNGIPIPHNMDALVDSYSLETNPLAMAQEAEILKARVAEMQSENPDFLIFFMHWGTEYRKAPDSWQEYFAKTLAEAGVDLVIGTHPHVVQPLCRLPANNKSGEMICYYSLGNLVSSQQKDTGNSEGRAEEGAIARIKLKKHKGETYLLSADYLPIYMYKTHPGYPLENRTYGWALPVEAALANPEKYAAENLQDRLEQALRSSRSVMGEAWTVQDSASKAKTAHAVDVK